jgi:hypothetical protein
MADDEEYVYSDDEYVYEEGPASPAAARSPKPASSAGVGSASSAR